MTRLGLFAVALLTLSGCTGTADDASPRAPGSAPAQEVMLQVFAAASLTDAFGQIAKEFEAANPGVTVQLSFAGSSDLAAQIAEGAPADVFASANEQQMEAAGDAVPSPHPFASNTLTIVVPADNPAGVTGLADLASEDVVLITCAPQVPCGAATADLARNEGVDLRPASEEASVTDVLGKVASGEADAGIVYETDVARAEGISSIAIEGAARVVTVYPIGALAESPNPDAAKAFVVWVLSDAGQAVLASHGFRAP